jgi:broad specificity phosphatase PhoE
MVVKHIIPPTPTIVPAHTPEPANNQKKTILFIGRHQERMDYPDEANYTKKQWESIRNAWFTSGHCARNAHDTPITEQGKAYAKKTGQMICQYHKKHPDVPLVLFASPYTRCIQTAGEIQLEVQKTIGKTIPIRIEYGLVEPFICSNRVTWSKQKQQFIWTANKQQNDNKNSKHNKSNQLIHSFPQYTFHTSYTSIMPYREYVEETLLDYASRLHQVLHTLKQSYKHNFIVCIGHGHLVRFGFESMTGIPLEESTSKGCTTTQGYGSFAIMDVLHGPNTHQDAVRVKTLCRGNSQYNTLPLSNTSLPKKEKKEKRKEKKKLFVKEKDKKKMNRTHNPFAIKS